MLYTRKGDKGTTQVFNCGQRISKSSAVTEALGACDEVNSLLGLCKVKATERRLELPDKSLVADFVGLLQHNLFVVQAELAGANKKIDQTKVEFLEKVTDEIETVLPPIKSFFVAGGTELATLFDWARTVARRSERRIIAAAEEGKVKISEGTLAYLNRLSSVLYALARLSNSESGITEEPPTYE